MRMRMRSVLSRAFVGLFFAVVLVAVGGTLALQHPAFLRDLAAKIGFRFLLPDSAVTMDDRVPALVSDGLFPLVITVEFDDALGKTTGEHVSYTLRIVNRGGVRILEESFPAQGEIVGPKVEVVRKPSVSRFKNVNHERITDVSVTVQCLLPGGAFCFIKPREILYREIMPEGASAPPNAVMGPGAHFYLSPTTHYSDTSRLLKGLERRFMPSSIPGLAALLFCAAVLCMSSVERLRRRVHFRPVAHPPRLSMLHNLVSLLQHGGNPREVLEKHFYHSLNFDEREALTNEKFRSIPVQLSAYRAMLERLIAEEEKTTS